MCDCCDYIAARAGSPDDPRLLADYERDWRRRVRAIVTGGGWDTMSVAEPWPGLSYTIGLWSHGHAELCVFGLEMSEAVPLLNVVAASVCGGAEPLVEGDHVDLDRRQLRVFRVPNPGAVLLRANAFYRRRPRQSVPALQLVYPDARGVWPWEPGCRQLPGRQPMPGTYAS